MKLTLFLRISELFSIFRLKLLENKKNKKNYFQIDIYDEIEKFNHIKIFQY